MKPDIPSRKIGEALEAIETWWEKEEQCLMSNVRKKLRELIDLHSDPTLSDRRRITHRIRAIAAKALDAIRMKRKPMNIRQVLQEAHTDLQLTEALYPAEEVYGSLTTNRITQYL